MAIVYWLPYAGGVTRRCPLNPRAHYALDPKGTSIWWQKHVSLFTVQLSLINYQSAYLSG